MMQLIVLGVLPGTDIQLSFSLIAEVFAAFVAILFIRSYFRSNRRKKELEKQGYTRNSVGSKIINLVPHSL